jgi:hypothetical protein
MISLIQRNLREKGVLQQARQRLTQRMSFGIHGCLQPVTIDHRKSCMVRDICVYKLPLRENWSQLNYVLNRPDIIFAFKLHEVIREISNIRLDRRRALLIYFARYSQHSIFKFRIYILRIVKYRILSVLSSYFQTHEWDLVHDLRQGSRKQMVKLKSIPVI